MRISQCGCIHEFETEYNILHSIKKCDHHKQKQNLTTGEKYYTNLGVLNSKGEIVIDHYETQIVEALGNFPIATKKAAALEIGTGISPYVRSIVASGYDYFGLEPDNWTVDWMRKRYNVPMLGQKFPGVLSLPVYNSTFHLVLAAHVLEHLSDVISSVKRIYELLIPSGLFYIIVPDDSDLVNPDHYWFFTTTSLTHLLEGVGFKIQKIKTRKYIQRENFLYCLVRKPNEN